MKNSLSRLLLISIIAVSCSVEQIAPRQELTPSSRHERIIAFIKKAEQQKLSKAEFSLQSEQLFLALGGVKIENEMTQKMFESVRKATPECEIANYNHYFWPDGTGTEVHGFSGCYGFCPDSGSGFSITEFDAKQNIVSSEIICVGDAA